MQLNDLKHPALTLSAAFALQTAFTAHPLQTLLAACWFQSVGVAYPPVAVVADMRRNACRAAAVFQLFRQAVHTHIQCINIFGHRLRKPAAFGRL